MKRLYVLLIVFWCCAVAFAAPAPDLTFVVFGRVVGLQGRVLTFAQRDGKSGTIELSPTVVFHDASVAPPALVDIGQLQQGDIFVLASDAAHKTHLIIAHPTGTPQRDWDALFARIVPGYKSFYAGRPGGEPATAPAAQGTATFRAPLTMVMMGKVGAAGNGTITVRRQNAQDATVTLPANAVFHDLSQPTSASSSLAQLRDGDDIVMTSDAADQPHVLFLHSGQTMNPSWKGMVTSGK